MNSFENFVASTEASRSDILRCLRLLRDLDERIAVHIMHLEHITESRLQYLSEKRNTSDEPPKDGGEKGGESQKMLHGLFNFHRQMIERLSQERHDIVHELYRQCGEVVKVSVKDLSQAYNTMTTTSQD